MWLLRFVVRSISRVNARLVLAGLAGACAGGLLVGVVDALLPPLGYTSESMAALLLVAGVGLSLFAHDPRRGPSHAGVALAVLLPTVGWAVAAPWNSVAAARGVAFLPYAWLGQVAVRSGAMLAAVLFVAGPVLAGVVCWPSLVRREGAAVRWRSYGVGLCLGVLLNVALFAPLFGSWPVLCTAGGVWSVVTLVTLVTLRRRSSDPVVDAAIEPAIVDTAIRRLERTCGVVLVGLAAACVVRMTFELVMPTVALLHLAWVGPLLGAVVLLAPRWRPAPEWATAIAVGWVMTLAALHAPLVDAVLVLNAYAESLWLQTLGRATVVLGLGVPIGIAWNLLRAPDADDGERSSWFESPGLFAVGIVLGTSVAAVFGEASLGCGIAVFVGAWIVGRRVVTWRLPAARWRRLVTYAVVAFLLAGPWWSKSYRPDRSARLLFSTSVVVSERSGTESRFHTQTDGARLVAARPGPYGTHTVWSHFGLLRELRLAGVPVGVTSRAPELCPLPVIETAVAAVPLAIHDAPRTVLLLGLDDGVPLATTLVFPVLEVHCAEGDRTRVSLLRSVVWNDGTVRSPLADDRTRLVEIDPRLAVRCDRGTYDVVISNPSHAGLARVAPLFTPGFYADCRARLAAGGVFCQRLRSVDYGPAVATDLMLDFRSAFPEAVVLAISPGELLLLGSNVPGTIKRGDLAERFALPHVRGVLARSGWDWSVPLSLATLDDEALDQLAARHGTRPAASRHGYRLANETLRWGTKLQDQSAALLHVATALGDRLPQNDKHLSEARARIADANRARDVQRNNPDEWWVYRGLLKQMLQSQPRTTTQLVSGTDGMHPVDKHRLDYLVALGDAYRENPPTVGAIHRVLGFARRGDPLVEPFARAEATRLFAECPERFPREELEQRLWLVLHADGDERSIRNPAATIDLIVDHPETLPDPAERWDVLNGLLQELAERWDARGRYDPLSAAVMRKDVAITLEAKRRAFAEMQVLSDAGAVPHAEWAARAAYLEDRLVRPLKHYRETLHNHAAAEADRARRATAAREE